MSVFEHHDERFAACVTDTASLRRLHTGAEWLEGPAWVPAGRYLVFSDVPEDRLLRWDEAAGAVATFREPAGNPNGSTLDHLGRLVTCEQGRRRVVRTEHDGSITVVADAHRGARLNSPNDVVAASDGGVWFTDPPYGIDSDYEGHRARSELGTNGVYRVDPATSAVELVIDDLVRPNGLAFSPDERRLYVSDTGATHQPGGPRHLRVFDLGADGRLTGGRVFAESTAGLFDGFRLDADGRVWTSAGDGVHCYDPDGTLLGEVLVPEVVSNVCFGGAGRSQLFITATTSLYVVRLRVRGAPLPLHRPHPSHDDTEEPA